MIFLITVTSCSLTCASVDLVLQLGSQIVIEPSTSQTEVYRSTASHFRLDSDDHVRIPRLGFDGPILRLYS